MPVNGVGTDVADAADVLGGGAGAGLAPAAALETGLGGPDAAQA
jgi:hypothetical protein